MKAYSLLLLLNCTIKKQFSSLYSQVFIKCVSPFIIIFKIFLPTLCFSCIKWKKKSSRSLLFMYVCTLGISPKFESTVACGLKFHWYFRTLGLKFQKARTKIEVFLALPCWLSQFSWDRKTSILLVASLIEKMWPTSYT